MAHNCLAHEDVWKTFLPKALPDIFRPPVANILGFTALWEIRSPALLVLVGPSLKVTYFTALSGLVVMLKSSTIIE